MEISESTVRALVLWAKYSWHRQRWGPQHAPSTCMCDLQNAVLLPTNRDADALGYDDLPDSVIYGFAY